MRLPLCYPIESRDGTLNIRLEDEEHGGRERRRRTGCREAARGDESGELPPGLAQGLFSLNGMAYAIVDDKLMGHSRRAVEAVAVLKDGCRYDNNPTIYPNVFEKRFVPLMGRWFPGNACVAADPGSVQTGSIGPQPHGLIGP